MTGFGRGTAAADEFSITVELKTVNNRFLDVNLRLSPELQDMEPMIKRVIGGRLARGRVDVNIQYERRAPVNFELNRPLISGFLSAMKEMKDEFSLDGGPDINVIARLPNVVAPKKEAIGDGFTSGMEKALTTALDDLQKMREEEGRMLREEVDSLLGEIARRLPPIQAEAANVTAEYQNRLTPGWPAGEAKQARLKISPTLAFWRRAAGARSAPRAPCCLRARGRRGRAADARR